MRPWPRPLYLGIAIAPSNMNISARYHEMSNKNAQNRKAHLAAHRGHGWNRLQISRMAKKVLKTLKIKQNETNTYKYTKGYKENKIINASRTWMQSVIQSVETSITHGICYRHCLTLAEACCPILLNCLANLYQDTLCENFEVKRFNMFRHNFHFTLLEMW